MKTFMKSLVFLVAIAVAGTAFGKNTLISNKGGTAKADLAKSWKKVKDGEYEFTLDTSKEVKKGVPVTGAMVKTSLEAKLGKTMGVKVTPNGDKVSVTYSGEEDEFLKKIGKTRVRPGGTTELALESDVSDGGMRANKKLRDPTTGEVRATVLKVKKGYVMGIVNKSMSKKIKSGKIKVTLPKGKSPKPGSAFIFTPETEKKGVWGPKPGKEFLLGK
jgi:hypothetical protein